MTARIAISILFVWSALLVVRGVARTTTWAAARTPPPPLAALRHRDPTFGRFHRLLDWVDETLPRDARVSLVGPGRPHWFGERATHYKIFRFRLAPRRTRPTKDPAAFAALIDWSDAIVSYDVPPLPVPPGFERIDAPDGDGRLYRRVARP